MSEWKIRPATVRGVLTNVYEQAGSVDGLAGAVTQDQASAVVEGVSWGGFYTQAVPAAVEVLMGTVAQDVGKIGNRVVAGVMGVSAAALAYQQGQEDMSAEAEQAMAAAVDHGDFSWFQAHGYMEGQVA